MPRFLIALMAAVTFALFLSGTAHARPPLSQNDHINNQLFAAAVGDEIRKNCSSISARMFLVWRKAKALEKYAYDQGYTEEEMRAYRKSKTEIKKMKNRRDSYLRENGVTRNDKDSYCRLGEAEIKAKSQIGELLNGR